MRCPQCGTENRPEARFCKWCATPLPLAPPTSPPSPEAPVAPPPPLVPPVPARRREPHEDLVGLVGFAFFLVGVAVLFAADPNAIGDVTVWSQSASIYRTPFVRPPDPLILGAAWFFVTVGVLGLIGAGMRRSLRWSPLRVLSEFLSAIGDLVFAVLLVRYADRAISGASLIMALVGLFAGFLMIYAVMAFYWNSARPYPPRRAGDAWVRP